MAVIDSLANFDIQNAAVSLWVCRGPTGPAMQPPRYSARWVEVADALAMALKGTVISARDRVEDVQDYDLLASPMEGGALTISADETNASLLAALVAAQTPDRRVRGIQDLQNAAFYIIKLIHGENIIHAVRRTDSIWKTKNALSVRTAIFQENELTIDDRPRFDISTFIDFIIVGDEILILDKGKFESILRYRQAHEEDFAALQAEPDFAAIFADLEPLRAHVGVNKIQLRRAAAIRHKGNYLSIDFMDQLRLQHHALGFSIEFDDAGRIVATPETCAEIMTALLDHRLSSVLSKRIYDVPSTTVVAI